eukprot:Nk52_evm2s263 gene=Nk52_evmTU2s263
MNCKLIVVLVVVAFCATALMGASAAPQCPGESLTSNSLYTFNQYFAEFSPKKVKISTAPLPGGTKSKCVVEFRFQEDTVTGSFEYDTKVRVEGTDTSSVYQKVGTKYTVNISSAFKSLYTEVSLNIKEASVQTSDTPPHVIHNVVGYLNFKYNGFAGTIPKAFVQKFIQNL